MNTMPHELVLGQVYVPPILIAIALAYGLTLSITELSTKLGLYKHIALPAAVELCLIVIFTCFFSQVISIF